MATVFPIDRAYKITTQANGQVADLGPGSFGVSIGTVAFQFVPDASFVGSLSVVAHATLKEEQGVAIPVPPFVAFPYRSGYLNGATPATPFNWDTAAITDDSVIHVPSNGMTIGLQITCSAGFGWLYTWCLEGTSAV